MMVILMLQHSFPNDWFVISYPLILAIKVRDKAASSAVTSSQDTSSLSPVNLKSSLRPLCPITLIWSPKQHNCHHKSYFSKKSLCFAGNHHIAIILLLLVDSFRLSNESCITGHNKINAPLKLHHRRYSITSAFNCPSYRSTINSESQISSIFIMKSIIPFWYVPKICLLRFCSASTDVPGSPWVTLRPWSQNAWSFFSNPSMTWTHRIGYGLQLTKF